ncbi:hypothetical protein MN116_005990 [Schistosoma mekongi]|uniref:Histone H2A n=1 Tax=Schistosoma mekongi TaxID=38744 RepID=A0AAE1ZA31_SCHME|nr:hypothetical protein MN116_005990 [Schistosoma mekongi]
MLYVADDAKYDLLAAIIDYLKVIIFQCKYCIAFCINLSFHLTTLGRPCSPIKSMFCGIIFKLPELGLQFLAGRVRRLLPKESQAERISTGAPVYLAAVLDYLEAEVLELAGTAARDNKMTRIILRYLQLAILKDEELNEFLGGVAIA